SRRARFETPIAKAGARASENPFRRALPPASRAGSEANSNKRYSYRPQSPSPPFHLPSLDLLQGHRAVEFAPHFASFGDQFFHIHRRRFIGHGLQSRDHFLVQATMMCLRPA